MLHVLVYGASCTGKTAWVNHILNRIPARNTYKSTEGLAISLFHWKETSVAIVDAGGKESNAELVEESLHDIHVVLLVYDSARARTLTDAINFYKTIPPNIPVVLAATTFYGRVNGDVVMQGKTHATRWGVPQYLVDPLSRSSCLLLLDMVIEASKTPRQLVVHTDTDTDNPEPEDECFPQCCHPRECSIM